jgi:hypothetical protein
LWGVETSAWAGKNYRVRWLQRISDFEIHNPGPLADATVSMQLGTFGKPHTARLEVNGAMAREAPRITQVFCSQGPQRVSFHVRLKPGVNSCRLFSLDSPDALPDGRQVCFLLVEEVIAVLDGR